MGPSWFILRSSLPQFMLRKTELVYSYLKSQRSLLTISDVPGPRKNGYIDQWLEIIVVLVTKLLWLSNIYESMGFYKAWETYFPPKNVHDVVSGLKENKD